MTIVNIYDAKASLSKLVERVLAGDEVIIGRAGKPVAKLVPYEADAAPATSRKGFGPVRSGWQMISTSSPKN